MCAPTTYCCFSQEGSVPSQYWVAYIHKLAAEGKATPPEKLCYSASRGRQHTPSALSQHSTVGSAAAAAAPQHCVCFWNQSMVRFAVKAGMERKRSMKVSTSRCSRPLQAGGQAEAEGGQHEFTC